MFKYACWFVGIISVGIATFIVMDAASISYATMVTERELETHPDKEAYNTEQETKFPGYTWVNKEEEAVTLPMDRAKDVILAELNGGTWKALTPKPFSLESLGITDEILLTQASNANSVAAGHEIYKTACVGCHGANAAGLSGPNLTDAYWLNGNEPTQIFTAVYQGVPVKGMPPWGPTYGAQVKDLVAFVLSVKDTNVEGKEPQGTNSEGVVAP